MNLMEVAKLTEDEARKLLENIRWPDGPVCPHCGSSEQIYTIKPNPAKKIRPGLYDCGACHKQFTVTVKTVMERSKLSLRQWVMAFYSVCAHKKGVSALQLQRDLGLGSYRTAWHLAHRIRHAMKEEPLASLLKGTVEADETYVGGKSRQQRRGRGSERKTPVAVLVERLGRVKAKPVERVNAKTLKKNILESVDRDSRIVSDEWGAYRGIGQSFAQGHYIVRHGIKEYVRGDVHTNTAESFFAILKRGVHGTFHSVSKKHLLRYCDEFAFRWNTRDTDDGDRMMAAIRGADGKRLTLRNPKGM